jgi:hypothetical protein
MFSLISKQRLSSSLQSITRYFQLPEERAEGTLKLVFDREILLFYNRVGHSSLNGGNHVSKAGAFPEHPS